MHEKKAADFLRFILGLICGLTAVCGTSVNPSARAAGSHTDAMPDPSRLLADAKGKEKSLPAYRTVATRTLSGGRTMTITKVVVNCPDNTRLSLTSRRVEAEGRVIHESRILSDARGDWTLLDRAAIKIPRNFDEISQQAGDLLAESATGTNPRPPTYTIDSVNWKGRPHFLVTRNEDRDELKRRIDFMTRFQQRRGGVMASIKPETLIEARNEYWIDAAAVFVVRSRAVAMAGNVITDDVLEEFDLHPSVPADFFTISPDIPLLFPKTDEEYRSVVTQYSRPAFGKQNNNKKKPKQ